VIAAGVINATKERERKFERSSGQKVLLCVGKHIPMIYLCCSCSYVYGHLHVIRERSLIFSLKVQLAMSVPLLAWPVAPRFACFEFGVAAMAPVVRSDSAAVRS
jgi:hypothetical protein